MVKFTRWLVYGVNHLLHAKFQQFTIYGFDAMTILVLTYFVDGFQPEGPLNSNNFLAFFHCYINMLRVEDNLVPRAFSLT